MHNIEEITKILSEYYPNEQTDLISINHFTFLIAVILSARNRDAQVNKVTENLFKYIATPQDIIDLGQDKLSHMIKNIGLYKNKAKYLFNLSKILLDKGYINGNIPDSFEELIQLPGIGIKTAYVTLSTLFNQPYIAVDTHVFRVSKRIWKNIGNNILQVTTTLNALPERYKRQLHMILIKHGRKICKIKPQCLSCPINKFCDKMSDNKLLT